MKLSIALAAVAAAGLCATGAQAQGYVRAGVGYERAADARFLDRDCASTAPPALFGCVAGADGQPLGGAGHHGAIGAGDLGVGWRLAPMLRLEAVATWRPGLDFRGDANFLRTPGEQPVTAGRSSSLGGFAMAYVDLPRLGPVQPFVGAGAGLARNRQGPVRYGFPGLAGGDASTTTSGGAATRFAWTASAGLSWQAAPRVTIDLAYRYADLGEMRTAPGPITIRRATGVRTLDVGATAARLETRGLSLGARLGF